MVFCWSCWLHGQLSSIDINCLNLKHKIVSFASTFVKISLFNKTMCEDESGESESGFPGKPLKPVYTDT